MSLMIPFIILYPIIFVQDSLSHPHKILHVGVFMSEACRTAQPHNECNDSVLSNKISSTLSNPAATTSTVEGATLAFLWHSDGTQMSS